MAGIPPADPRGGRDPGDRPLTSADGSAPRAPRRTGRGSTAAGIPAAPPKAADADSLATRLLTARPGRTFAWTAAGIVLAAFAAGVVTGAVKQRAGPAPAPSADAPATPAPDAAEDPTGFGEALRRLDAFVRGEPAAGDPGVRERIALLRERALAARDGGDPDSARRLLGDAERIARQAARDSEARYRFSLEAANAAHGRGDAAAARAHLGRALAERPGAPEAEALRARIEAAPPPGAAAPREAQSRAGELARLLGEGRLAAENGDPAAARRALAAAEAIDPGHGGVRDLRARVERLERDIERDRLVAGAEEAAARDDWEGALRGFGDARALDPVHEPALRGHGLAKRVTDAQASVDGFLERPERLSDESVAAAVGSALETTVPLAPLSPRLRDAAEELRTAVATWRTPVPVRVLSDNRTEIGIRGVGRIGRVEERIVELPPGTYAFEGRREGYRSKIVEVTVAADPAAPPEVRIVCDEPG